MTRAPEGGLLTAGALNRALLARQHLLARADAPARDVVGHLVGLQAQNAWSPYVGLWSRVEGFGHDEIGDALVARSAARIAVMRGTIHLVTAPDALLLPALTAPLYERDLAVNQAHAAPLREVDLGQVTVAARALVEQQPLATTELGRRLAERWPHVPPGSLAYAARNTLPMVQVPPRGVWRRSGATTWTTAWSWLDPALVAATPDVRDPDARAAELGLLAARYFAAFGPATVADFQSWSGLRGLGDVVEDLVRRGALVAFTAEPSPGKARARVLYDLPDAPRPAEDTPAPPRFLPDYDNVLLGHADRNRIVDDARRRSLQARNGVIPGTVLLDGRVGATWTVQRSPLAPEGRRKRELATLVVKPFHLAGSATRLALADEAERFVRYLADDAAEHAVEVTAPTG